uniref:Uncharacterized protein n=2 Tax=Tetranychus urticae TaxID=32264 RepID=T1KJQ6_TETUR
MITYKSLCLTSFLLVTFTFIKILASETINVHLSNDTSISSSEPSSTDHSSSFTPFNSNVNQIVRGYPCVKKSNQLYCGSPGQIYPR